MERELNDTYAIKEQYLQVLLDNKEGILKEINELIQREFNEQVKITSSAKSHDLYFNICFLFEGKWHKIGHMSIHTHLNEGHLNSKTGAFHIKNNIRGKTYRLRLAYGEQQHTNIVSTSVSGGLHFKINDTPIEQSINTTDQSAPKKDNTPIEPSINTTDQSAPKKDNTPIEPSINTTDQSTPKKDNTEQFTLNKNSEKEGNVKKNKTTQPTEKNKRKEIAAAAKEEKKQQALQKEREIEEYKKKLKEQEETLTYFQSFKNITFNILNKYIDEDKNKVLSIEDIDKSTELREQLVKSKEMLNNEKKNFDKSHENIKKLIESIFNLLNSITYKLKYEQKINLNKYTDCGNNLTNSYNEITKNIEKLEENYIQQVLYILTKENRDALGKNVEKDIFKLLSILFSSLDEKLVYDERISLIDILNQLVSIFSNYATIIENIRSLFNLLSRINIAINKQINNTQNQGLKNFIQSLSNSIPKPDKNIDVNILNIYVKNNNTKLGELREKYRAGHSNGAQNTKIAEKNKKYFDHCEEEQKGGGTPNYYEIERHFLIEFEDLNNEYKDLHILSDSNNLENFIYDKNKKISINMLPTIQKSFVKKGIAIVEGIYKIVKDVQNKVLTSSGKTKRRRIFMKTRCRKGKYGTSCRKTTTRKINKSLPLVK